MAIEFWTRARPLPGTSKGAAVRAEEEGWDGLAFTDSQNLSGDPYVALGIAAAATERLQLGTGVTNPWTRHPAVTASAISCVHVESGGRATLGIGRGDSSLAYLGLAPASIAAFQDYLTDLGAYLRGDPVPLERTAGSGREADAALLPMGAGPTESRIAWLAGGSEVGSVPVFVVASGPRVIAIGARHAQRVTLAVGADTARVAWAVQEARSARPDVAVGAYVNVVVDEDRDQARALGAGAIASIARFSAMHGHMSGPADESQRAVIEAIPGSYDMHKHFATGRQADLVTEDFADRFAILGPASYCVERLEELAEIGIDRFHIMGVSRDVDPEIARSSYDAFVEQVLGRVRDG